MDKRMELNDAPAHVYPGGNPPPYPGPPAGPSQTVQAGYPLITQPQVTVVHQTPTVVQGATVIPATVIVANNMAPGPTGYVCKSCHQQIITRVERNPGMKTHLFAALLCVVGLWPCVCIPYCVDSCNNAEHYCPNCGAYVGTYSA